MEYGKLVSHGHCGLYGDKDGGGGWYACGTKPGVVHVSGDADHFPSVR